MKNRGLFFQWPHQNNLHPGDQIAIVGSGITGLCVAYFAGLKNLKIDIFDQYNEICSSTSSVPLASVHPIWSAQPEPVADFSWRAYRFAKNFYQFHKDDFFYEFLDFHFLEKARTGQNSSQIFSEETKIQNESLIFPQNGTINPKHFFGSLNYKNLKKIQSKIDSYSEVQENVFLNSSQKKFGPYKKVIFCIGASFLKNSFFKNFIHKTKLHGVRGQIEFLSTPMSEKNFSKMGENTWLHHPQFGTSYGGIFDRNSIEPSPLKKDREFLLQSLKNENFHEIQNINWDNSVSWSETRLMSADRLPILGPIPDWHSAEQIANTVHKGQKTRDLPPHPSSKNVFLFFGLGSRTLCHAPILAQTLIHEISGEKGLESEILPMLHPFRFELKRILSKATR